MSLFLKKKKKKSEKLFCEQIPPISTLEVGFLSVKKSFSQIFQNTQFFFHLNFIFKKSEAF